MMCVNGKLPPTQTYFSKIDDFRQTQCLSVRASVCSFINPSFRPFICRSAMSFSFSLLESTYALLRLLRKLSPSSLIVYFSCVQNSLACGLDTRLIYHLMLVCISLYHHLHISFLLILSSYTPSLIPNHWPTSGPCFVTVNHLYPRSVETGCNLGQKILRFIIFLI